MSHCAEFQIIGRIGQIKKSARRSASPLPPATPTRTTAANGRSAPAGTRSRWFNDARQSHVQRNLKAGDLIRATGVIEQTSWEKNGENPLRRHPRLQADRSPRQGPGPRGRRRRTGSTEPLERDQRRHPVLTEASGGESLPFDPAAATNPSPLGGLHGRLPQTEGPHAGRTRGSGRRRRARGHLSTVSILWLY